MGAQTLISQKQQKQSTKSEEVILKLEKGSYVKILTGKNSGNYGQVEGFDDNAERVIVKLALSGLSESYSEFVLQLVTKDEYAKNSKVISEYHRGLLTGNYRYEIEFKK